MPRPNSAPPISSSVRGGGSLRAHPDTSAMTAAVDMSAA